MAIGGNGQRSGGRRLWLIAALAGWVMLILVAAGRRPEDPPLVGVKNFDAVLLVGVLLVAALGLVMLIVLNPFQSEWTEPGRRRGSYGYLVLLLGALALLFWSPELLEDVLAEREDEEEESGDDELAELLAERENQPAPETVAEATDILALVVVAGGIVGAVFLFKNRAAPPPPAPADEDFEAELIVAMDEARLELGEAGDPRSAVLNAYRSLEVVLESRGSPRARSETTAEHITRSLRTLTVDPAPIVHLAELYQIARFSDRPITVDQQTSARAALERSTAELRR